jgi:hypothetical protein
MFIGISQVKKVALENYLIIGNRTPTVPINNKSNPLI